MKNLKIVGMLVISYLIIIILFSGCTEDSESENHKSINYQFSIEIFNNESSSYEIIVPIPLDEENNESFSLLRDLIISGNVTYNISNSIHGIALLIRGKGNITIYSEGQDILPISWLSMINDTNDNGINDEFNKVEFWIFLNSTDEDIKLIESLRTYDPKTKYTYNSWINTEIHQGWQIVSGRRNIEIE